MKKINFCITSVLLLLVLNGYSQESWTPTTYNNAPSARIWHTAVWTGSKMIIWGGQSNYVDVKTGGVYNVESNSWSPTNILNAPEERELHKAVWTGSKMIVWGGVNFLPTFTFPNIGGIYDPESNTWVPTSAVNAPSGRVYHTLIWTGDKMIVWGGVTNNGLSNEGKLYDPNNNTWTDMSTVNAPVERDYHTTIWTGSKMIIWGGETGANVMINTGGSYDPVLNSWDSISTINAPAPRTQHTAVWTGSKMIVWGGVGNDGGIYDPMTDTWQPTSLTNVPQPRFVHTAVWTGIRMIVWGGILVGGGGYPIKTGGIYDPLTDSWSATTLVNAPAARYIHTAIWTGNKMIVWGGEEINGPLNSGGIYFNSNVIGIENLGTGVPQEYKLFQNYPNPFNPTTRIKFSIPLSRGVSEGRGVLTHLAIFDILGREVAVLNNEQLKPGTYEVEWDAGNYPSGVYFYQLSINNEQLATKKMVLIK